MPPVKASDPLPERWILVLVALCLGGVVLLLPPVNGGDAGEYLLMAESLYRHGSPDLRQSDVRALGTLEVRSRGDLNLLDAFRGYFDSPRGGRYSYHFWGYSLFTVPAKALLRAVGIDELRAAPVTNGILFFVALLGCLGAPGPPARGLGLFLLSLFSPALFLLRWPHTEVASFSLVTLALLWDERGMGGRAVLAASLAAMQNPPLGALVFVLVVDGLRRGDGPLLRRAGRVLPACLPAVLSMAFYYREFGTLSLIGRDAASSGMLSPGKAVELFLDPNLGLLPYLPLTLPLFGARVLRAVFRREPPLVLRNAVLLALLALACTATLNWNHGTSGPSRYTAWMLPLIFQGVLPPGGTPWPRSLALAVASQACLVIVHGGPQGRPDHLEHSLAARVVLRLAPRAYNPTPDIFVIRTQNKEGPPEGPVVYRPAGVCLKAYARPEDAPALERLCGEPGTRRGGAGFDYVDFGGTPRSTASSAP
jgi:hypothetical protein